MLGGEPRGFGLEQRANREQLVGLVMRRCVHESAVAGAQVDPPLVGQPLQRLANRLPGHPQDFGQLAFHQVLAGSETSRDDEILHRLVYPLAEGHRPIDPARSQILRQLGRLHKVAPMSIAYSIQ